MVELRICAVNLAVFVGLLSTALGSSYEEIHKFMTKRELQSVFGHHQNIPDYNVATVTLHQPQRRSLPQFMEERYHLVAHVQLKGEVLRMQLEQHSSIVSPDFHMVFEEHNNTVVIPPHEIPTPECLYNGAVTSEHGGQAAVSTCDGTGMTGLIITRVGYFIIKPLPRRLHEMGNDHVIYTRNDSNWPVLADTDSMVPPPPTKDEFDHQNQKDEESDDFNNEIDDYGGKQKRIRRAANNKVIEICIFTDRHMYENVKKEMTNPDKGVKDIVFTMINAVQLLYNQPGLGTNFKIVIVKLVVLKSNAKGLKESEEIKQYLTDFCTYQKNQNPSFDSNVNHWDHAIMLSGLDLMQLESNTKNHKVIGLAWVSGMCRPTYSCTMNEGKCFESVFVITHEMGHNLGMHHDGKDNKCNDKTNIMSPTLGPGKIAWSTCSRDYLNKFLKNKDANCLNDNATPSSAYNHEKDGTLPGERFDIDDQCRKAFGADHAPHKNTKKPFDDICRELWCRKGSSARRAHPALDGTKCGTGKVCMYGQCITRSGGSGGSSKKG